MRRASGARSGRVGLVGRNGSGKSSLRRIIAGKIPAAGHDRWDLLDTGQAHRSGSGSDPGVVMSLL
ncbi:ATP-binding cassette domain-containing protein [Bradyrhizobium sp. STM 3557]|uniref:ATP-binding cassette domain-containing protein n=1 Tax=Bradyrhizobium sp. STM 3557 TaxID=578920 RepID=UPI00388F225E